MLLLWKGWLQISSLLFVAQFLVLLEVNSFNFTLRYGGCGTSFCYLLNVLLKHSSNKHCLVKTTLFKKTKYGAQLQNAAKIHLHFGRFLPFVLR